MTDVWKSHREPTRRELDQRKADADARRASPQPYQGKPGFTIVDGKLQYDPSKDPDGKAYKST